MYAIVRAGGRQEKVAVGDVIELNRLSAQPGDSVTLPVLLVVNEGSVTAGEAAAATTVSAEVLEHTKGEKIRILRYKNKTGYRRRQGHRQALTKLRVTGIEAGK